ncbi:MAG TPA: PRC-barrel domain-containing protein [Negativicutes bacterium]|nr:PRC-barrel domain-containing protein [Negativicutes bacterium]
MPTINELRGLPVINLSTGEQIGEVKDVVIDTANYRLVGVLLSRAGWFHTGRGILLGGMKNIGPDSITIEDETAIVSAEALAAGGRTILNEDIIGKDLVTAEGNIVGTLSDVLLDVKSGLLTGYEVSDSVIGDLLEGRSNIPLPAQQRIGENAVIVPDKEQPVEVNKTG